MVRLMITVVIVSVSPRSRVSFRVRVIFSVSPKSRVSLRVRLRIRPRFRVGLELWLVL
jgi:hypothetical protein